MKDYKLMNVATGRIFEDQGWTLDDPEGKTPSMVRAIYEHKQLRVSDDERLGLYKFADWMGGGADEGKGLPSGDTEVPLPGREAAPSWLRGGLEVGYGAGRREEP